MANIPELLHRAFSVFCFKDSKLLLQQRALEKITFPGCWTNSCCSHPLWRPDEMIQKAHLGVRNACVRKLEHELGVATASIDINKLQFLTRIHYVAPSDGEWGEHEIDYIFIYNSPLELEPNPNEVMETRYVTRQELAEMLEDPNIPITPWFKLIAETFLFKWWDNLEQLEQFSDSEIHRL